ncbi:Glycoside hydrolase family 18, catalytic domain [Sesbania bispinosa]|nr:Glycoside hydrolase family 18, catalytic domain [Sesbania bispinosa]
MSSSVDVNFCRQRIFREYIGVEPYPFPGDLPDQLFPHDKIINPDVPEFHYILAFASEHYIDGKEGTGYFMRNWSCSWKRHGNNRKGAGHFSPEDVRKIKVKFPNVKVIISIGGRGDQYPFNPAFKEVWADNAIVSLKKILSEYSGAIDGIDINYEVIKSSEADFAYCIGKVINGLMNFENVKVMSIAPSQAVRSHYKALYQAHKDDIAWVNYQFYNQPVPSVDDFLRIYISLLSIDGYNVHKPLPGYSTDPKDQLNLPLNVFLDGCAELKRLELLNGIFIWRALDDSPSPFPPFHIEEKAQKLVIH